jgi:primosomal protein N' (replication factor Y)
VEVALPVPLFRTFTYQVPEGIAVPIPVGSRVLVPFHGRQEVGICLGMTPPPDGIALKPLLRVLDSVPAVPAALLETARWIAEWYAAPLGLTLRAMLPATLGTPRAKPSAEKRQRFVTIQQELPSLLERERLFARSPQQRTVYELLEAQGGTAALTAVREQAQCSAGVLAAMVKRGIVVVHDDVVRRDPFAARPGVAPPPTPARWPPWPPTGGGSLSGGAPALLFGGGGALGGCIAGRGLPGAALVFGGKGLWGLLRAVNVD